MGIDGRERGGREGGKEGGMEVGREGRRVREACVEFIIWRH